MQFKTVISDQGAWRGYVVTTSTFTRDAEEYAREAHNMILIDMDELVRWHRDGLAF